MDDYGKRGPEASYERGGRALPAVFRNHAMAASGRFGHGPDTENKSSTMEIVFMKVTMLDHSNGTTPGECPRRMGAVAAVLLGLTLAACGGGSGNGDSGSGETIDTNDPDVTITPSLGRVTHADVEVRCLADQRVLGSSSTGAEGTVTISMDGSCGGPRLVSVSGNDSASYFDEAYRGVQVFGNGDRIRALAPATATAIGVTALTEISVGWVEAQHGGTLSTNMTNDDVTAANSDVATGLAPEIDDILTPPRPWDQNSVAGSLGDTQEDRYALRLAALANLGTAVPADDGSDRPVLDILCQLRWDIADGALDGSGAGATPPCGDRLRYAPDQFAADWHDRLDTDVQEYGNAALQEAVNNYPSPGGLSAIDAGPGSDVDNGSGDSAQLPQIRTTWELMGIYAYEFPSSTCSKAGSLSSASGSIDSAGGIAISGIADSPSMGSMDSYPSLTADTTLGVSLDWRNDSETVDHISMHFGPFGNFLDVYGSPDAYACIDVGAPAAGAAALNPVARIKELLGVPSGSSVTYTCDSINDTTSVVIDDNGIAAGPGGNVILPFDRFTSFNYDEKWSKYDTAKFEVDLSAGTYPSLNTISFGYRSDYRGLSTQNFVIATSDGTAAVCVAPMKQQ